MICNHRHRLFGHLFSGRCKALPVDGSGSGYRKSVCDRVDLNPVRAKTVGRKEKLSAFRRSSYPQYLKAHASRPARLGDWGRDAALWLGRLGELGQLAGGLDYAGVGQAVSRCGKRLQKGRELPRQLRKLDQQLSKVEM